jgi:hypothetical protein
MQLRLRLSFHLRHSLGGYTSGKTAGFQDEVVEALAPQTLRLNPTEVPTVACEHKFHLPLRGQIFVAHSNRRHGGYCRGKLPQYHEMPITACGYGYDRLLPAAKGWGAIHPIPYKGPTTPG